MKEQYWRIFQFLSRQLKICLLIFLAVFLIVFSTPVFAQVNSVNPQQTGVCYWYGTIYYPGQTITDIAGQQYLCNADGTLTYIGLTPTYPSYLNPYPYPYPFDYNVGYSPSVLTSYLYSAYSLPNYQFPYIPTNQFPVDSPNVSAASDANVQPQLEYFEQTCVWNGTVYKPGQRFCNSACQEYICNSDGSIVWTGMVRNVTCPTCINMTEPGK